MIPRTPLLFTVALAGAALVLGMWYPAFTLVGLAANGVLALVAGLDLYRTVRPDRFETLREVSNVLSVGAQNPVVLRLLSRAPGPMTLEVTDEPPEPSRVEGLPIEVELTPQREVEVT